MLSERELKTEVRRALDGVLPPAPWLEAAVAEHLDERLRRPARPARRRFTFTGAAALLVALALAAALLLAQLYVPRSVPGAPIGLTSSEQSQLAILEARPLDYPAVPNSGLCPVSPMSLVHPWSDQTDSTLLSGVSPAFIGGGVGVLNTDRYVDLIFYLDPTARGVVLFRGRNLSVGNTVYFTGQWSAGPIAANDTLGGQAVGLRNGVAFPADRPPHNALAAPSWGLWAGRTKADAFNTGDCVAFQADYASGSELIVFYS